MNSYRIFGAAIDAALKRGWHVECWHNIENMSADKGLTFPQIERAPIFPNGKVTFREYRGLKELSVLMSKKIVDVVINNIPPCGLQLGDWPSARERSLYVLLAAFSGEWYYYVSNPEELKQIDLIALHTSYWFEYDLKCMKEICKIPITQEIESDIRRKTVIVGLTEIDQLSMIDPIEVRRQWGIPEKQPVIAYLNFPNLGFYDFKQRVFLATSLKNKIAAHIKFSNKWQVAKTMFGEPDHKNILKSIKLFCDKNKGFLILKCRFRDVPSKYEIRIADKVIFDESYYPHTILKLMSISDFCIGYFSYALLEASAAGVPYLSLDAGGVADICSLNEEKPSFFRRLSKLGEFFNFPGVSSIMDSREIMHRLPTMKLCDFKINADAQGKFFRNYLGLPGECHCDRFLDEVEKIAGH